MSEPVDVQKDTVLRYASLCFAMLCCTMLCYASLCFATLCFVMCFPGLPVTGDPFGVTSHRYAFLQLAVFCYALIC